MRSYERKSNTIIYAASDISESKISQPLLANAPPVASHFNHGTVFSRMMSMH